MSEGEIRLVIFSSIFVLMFAFESWLPRRRRTENRSRRTIHNLLISGLNSVLIRFVPVFSAVGAATFDQQHNWGLLNQFVMPTWLEYTIVVVILDCAIYWQHVAAHRIPMLWQIHKVHHADHDLDASSGLRFHPIEIAFSMLVKCTAVVVLGASPDSVMLFEIVLSSCAVFNHSNVALPSRIERFLRVFIVTPDMHRIHHSVHIDETDSNYGFNIAAWDRLFGTYRPEPKDGHLEMKLGLPEYPESEKTTPINAMLMMPFESSDREVA